MSKSICLITGIFPPDVGGPATYVSNLALALHRTQHQVCVMSQGGGYRDYPFPVKRISRFYPLLVRLAVIFIKLLWYGWRSDVWYINGLELPAVLAGKLLRKRMVMKVVGDYAWERAMNGGLTTDSLDQFQDRKQIWKVELHKHLRAWCTRQVHRVITPSYYLKNLVCGWGIVADRVQVIYNAIEELPDTLPFPSEIRKQLGFGEDDRVMITVGRLVSWKGIDHLIRILEHFEVSVKLLIVGDGPEKNILTTLAETLNVAHRITFLGKVERRDVLACLKAADTFVLPTAYEGFSHVILEAMMVGTPVIATNVGGNPELVKHGENGMLIPYGNLQELIGQIDRVLHDPALQDHLIQGGRQTAQQFSWEWLFQQTLNVLCQA